MSVIVLPGEDNLQVVEDKITEQEAELVRLKSVRDVLKEQCVESSLKITYSLDRTLYYITDHLNMPRAWFGVEKLTTKPLESDAPFMGGFTQTTLHDGTVYWRSYYPFNFWSVKAGERKTPITLEDDLAKDYVGWAVQQWNWKGYDKYKPQELENVIAGV